MIDAENYDELTEEEKIKLNLFYGNFTIVYPIDNSKEGAELLYHALDGAIGIIELRSRVGYDNMYGVVLGNYNVMS